MNKAEGVPIRPVLAFCVIVRRQQSGHGGSGLDGKRANCILI